MDDTVDVSDTGAGLSRGWAGRRGRGAAVAGLLVLAAMLLLPGCATPSRQLAVSSEPVRPVEPDAMRFALGGAILSGFDLDDPEADGSAAAAGWRAGDRILIGLVVSRPAGRGGAGGEGEKGGETGELVRYLDIELTGEVGDPPMVAITYRPEGAEPIRFESLTLATEIRVYDEAARPIGKSRGAFPTMLLDVGPYDAALYDLARRAAGLRPGDGHGPTDRDEVRRGVMGWMSLVMFSGSMGKNRVFTRLVDEIVDRPSLLAWLFSPAVSLDDAADGPGVIDGGIRIGPDAVRPACRVPLDVRMAGKPVVRTRMIVTPCRAPLGLCGGVIALDGEKADDPGVKVHLELLAATRGQATRAVAGGGAR